MSIQENKIISMYWHGFHTMRLGRTLWMIILIKLVIIFGVLKLFFFPDLLASNFATDEQRANHVFENITHIPTSTPR